MGQYYRPILGDKYGLNGRVFDRSVDGQYTWAKLMEHAWWSNPFVNAFSEFLYKEAGRVIWLGDYGNEPEDFYFPNCSAFYVPCYKAIWGDDVILESVSSSDFTLDNRFIVNHDTKEYIDLNEYKSASIDKHGWTIHPLPLLTAVGNDRGSGDFHEPSLLSVQEVSTAKGNIERLATVEVSVMLICSESGESLTLKGLGSGQDASDKALAKAQTMALKYCVRSDRISIETE